MCSWAFTKKSLSRTLEVDFEAAEDIINSIFAGDGQYSDYLQSYILEYLQSN